MHILVLGAGIVGVTTAYQLLRDGHQVTLVDRATGPAEFTSFANAGLVAPGHAYAWASPAAPGMMWRSLWRGDQAIRFRPRASAAQWRWLRQFLGECTTERAAANTALKTRLCRYSQAILGEVVADTGVSYDRGTGGLVYFYRSAARFEAAARRADLLRAEGMVIEVLDRPGVAARDPGLGGAIDQIAGALCAPGDESGDAHLFARALALECARLGATIRHGTEATGWLTDGTRITALRTAQGPIPADEFVVCLGVMSPQLVAGLGLRLPIYPVKGYSVTVPLADLDHRPQLGGVDEENLLAYCPMGDRLRLTATAEIAGYSTAHRPGDFAHMVDRARALFGPRLGAGQIAYWAGLRPMTPTGLPVVDRSPIDNLWLNTGHGHMGWTMSNGCARIIADLIGQRQPQHATTGMRYDDHAA